MDDYIKNVLNNLDVTSNLLTDIGNGILLTNREIEVLDRYDIKYKNVVSLKELLYKIEDFKNDNYSSDLDDLEDISLSIAERDYYQNTNK